MRRASTRQELELLEASQLYNHNPLYRNPPDPILDNVFYCCSQKTGSQWLKSIFLDPTFYQATGLRIMPYVALGNKFAKIEEPAPRGTIVTHLYVGYETYASIAKPKRFKTFYILRDPRDIVVSWYYSAKNSHGLIDPIPRLREQLKRSAFEDGMIFIIDELESWGFFDCQRSWVTEAQHDPAVRIFRYEDMARNEATFLKELFKYLGISLDAESFASLCQRHAFERYAGGRRKGQEDPSSHYRSGVTGGWTEKFNDRIQTYFRETTGDLITALGYSE
ncbi:MAG: sulfotransferase domain-containing protein [Alphaproteobacteria bacterium]|nr:sulfotransferase domain-containing protein [Alphaproteobacteria bacterium]